MAARKKQIEAVTPVTFNNGDTVRLKSGGPKMVFRTIKDDPESGLCTWFEGLSSNTDRFQIELLMRALDNDMIGVGDVVQLKSGGPAMTVSSVIVDRGETHVYCKWFTVRNDSAPGFGNRNGTRDQLDRDRFPGAALRKHY